MNVLIVGATSGIGKELAKIFVQNGYRVAASGRRSELLQALQANYSEAELLIETMDIAQCEQSRKQFLQIAEKMGGLDIVVINAAIGDLSTKWENEAAMIQVNVAGFAAIANAAYYYFDKQRSGRGQIVGISSVAAEAGSSQATTYSASKAFISHYMQGLRFRNSHKKTNICITDIRPGFVDTPMTAQNNFYMPWLAKPEVAAQQIFMDIKNRRKITYITRRWRLVSWLIRLLPEYILAKVL